MVGSKEVVKDHDKPRWIKKKGLPEVTKSWHNYMVKKVIQDFQATVLQVSETPYDEKIVSTIPAVQYEFPTGYHQVYIRFTYCFYNIIYKLQNKIRKNYFRISEVKDFEYQRHYLILV